MFLISGKSTSEDSGGASLSESSWIASDLLRASFRGCGLAAGSLLKLVSGAELEIGSLMSYNAT